MNDLQSCNHPLWLLEKFVPFQEIPQFNATEGLQVLNGKLFLSNLCKIHYIYAQCNNL